MASGPIDPGAPQEHLYSYARFSDEAIRERVIAAYRLGEDTACRYYVQGFHDNYLVQTPANKFILRLFRHGARSMDEIRFELELLAFLHGKSLPVAQPLPTKTGALLAQVDCAEGERAMALFPYAPGTAPHTRLTAQQARLLGRTVAGIHAAADTHQPQHARQELSLEYLLDASATAIGPFLSEGQHTYISRLQGSLRDRLPAIPKTAPFFGICTGDVNPRNFHLTEAGGITLFDFDQCGYGWRAFEIGKFLSSIHHFGNAAELGGAFIGGYDSVRPLSAAEREAIPAFLLVSLIWVMALHAYNVDLIGYKLLEPEFWERKIGSLRGLEERLLG
jgi:Ser/Thr protein kinase RdoA (MazF antagonist)